MYEETTRSIRVRVEPLFLEEQSSPAEEYYYWAYDVEIQNLGTYPVQLQERYWQITDSSGYTEEVRGEGVVGKQPVIEPGGSFSYTSSAPLRTPSGIMRGTYFFEADTGELFEVNIPAFSLDSPYAERVMN